MIRRRRRYIIWNCGTVKERNKESARNFLKHNFYSLHTVSDSSFESKAMIPTIFKFNKQTLREKFTDLAYSFRFANTDQIFNKQDFQLQYTRTLPFKTSEKCNILYNTTRTSQQYDVMLLTPVAK